MSQRNRAGFSKLAFVAILLVVLVVGAVGSIALGYGYVGIKQPSQQVQLASGVCDEKVVDAYNVAQNSNEKRVAQTATLAQSIMAKSGHESDSTCLYILAQQQLRDGNTIAANKYLGLLKVNVAKGLYVSSNLYGLGSVDLLESTIKSYRTSETQTPVGEG
jgi:hypothetical protein